MVTASSGAEDAFLNGRTLEAVGFRPPAIARPNCPADSSGPAPVCRSARASPPRPSTRPRIRDGLGHQLVMLRPDGQPAVDLLEDLGGIPPCPGRVMQPTGAAKAPRLAAVRQAAQAVGSCARPVALPWRRGGGVADMRKSRGGVVATCHPDPWRPIIYLEAAR
jgi:hypothetical protein